MDAKQKTQLTRRQIQVIDELCNAELSEAKILKKYGVSYAIYRRWLSTDLFSEEMDFRMGAARRQSQFIVAKFTPHVATKLIKLTESEKEETARKACVDILQMPATVSGLNKKNDHQPDSEIPITQATATKILAALAKQTEDKTR